MRQPYAELILRGVKTIDYRSRPAARPLFTDGAIAVADDNKGEGIEVGDRVEHHGTFGWVLLMMDTGVCLVEMDGKGLRSVPMHEATLIEKTKPADPPRRSDLWDAISAALTSGSPRF